MTLRDQPIRRKLMAIILMTSGAVLLLTCGAFIVSEWITFRHGLVQSLATLARITADNSSAALAFRNTENFLYAIRPTRRPWPFHRRWERTAISSLNPTWSCINR